MDQQSKKTVSVIIPYMNEVESIGPLMERLRNVADNDVRVCWEFVLVDDGSTDGSSMVVERLRESDNRVVTLRLSRNFGKEAAMLAGLDHMTGDCAVFLDADMQHPPETIPDMIDVWLAGKADDVVGRRLTRGEESGVRRVLTHIFYVCGRMCGLTGGDENSGDFRLIDRRLVDALRLMRECVRLTKPLIEYAGFRKAYVDFATEPRRYGHSKHTIGRLVTLALRGVTMTTTRPLRLIWIGAAFLVLGAVIAALTSWGRWIPTLILAVGAMQMAAIGLVAVYVGNGTMESRRRPPYFVMEKNGSKKV